MSAASLVIFLLRKKVGLRQRMIMAQAMSLNDMQGVVHLQKTVLLGSLSFQLLGAVVLTLRFLPEYGIKQAAIWGVFHAISAFCNAGFDLMGDVEKFSSFTAYAGNIHLNTVVILLIVIGGIIWWFVSNML